MIALIILIRVRENPLDLDLRQGITLQSILILSHQILELNVIDVGLVMFVIHIGMAQLI